MQAIRDAVVAALNYAVENRNKVQVGVLNSENKEMYSLYDDSNGQRGVVVIGGPYNNPRHFRLARKLSFVNEGDEGKEGAILGCLRPDMADVCSIEMSAGFPKKIQLDSIRIYIL